MKIEKIHQIALGANDLDESVAFYQDVLGARLIARYDPPGLAFFDLGGVRLMLEENASPATVYYWVEDIDAAFAELSQKVKFETEPHCIFPDSEGTFGTAGEEEWMTFFRDPADNTVAIATRRFSG